MPRKTVPKNQKNSSQSGDKRRQVEPKLRIRDERRVASAVIRGYLAQFTLTALYWLDLGDDETLFVEGNEDLDRYFSVNGVPSVEEIQTKELGGTITERNADIRETIANFIVAFEEHRGTGRTCRLVFRTTASMGKAHSPVLAPWMAGDSIADDVFEAGLLGIVKDADSTGAGIALGNLLKDNLLGEFRDSVVWAFRQPKLNETGAQLIARLESHEIARKLGPTTVYDLLIKRILDLASIPVASGRCLTRLSLDRLLGDYAIDKAILDFDKYPLVVADRVFIQYRNARPGDAVLVGLVLDRPEEAEAAWRRQLEDSAALSKLKPVESIEAALVDPRHRALHSKTGFDLYGVFVEGSKESGKRLFRALLKDLLHFLEAGRARALHVSVPATWLADVTSVVNTSSRRLSPGTVQASDDSFGVLLSGFWTDTLGQIVQNPSDQSSRTILQENLPKIRCVYDRTDRQYYARENPITERVRAR